MLMDYEIGHPQQESMQSSTMHQSDKKTCSNPRVGDDHVVDLDTNSHVGDDCMVDLGTKSRVEDNWAMFPEGGRLLSGQQSSTFRKCSEQRTYNNTTPHSPKIEEQEEIY
ncbi:hypothetical protein KIW84_051630 [Lathyrus oleraceus]|uniref:Uncharacterized protein n=1 Tax=Pisum sativum TaxID=3888 RepID=A0A9D4WLK9_PEA|nr:hypothetical protein KIW84_051630 [Pisum sativum]